MSSFEGNLLAQRKKIAHKKVETLGYRTVKTRSLYLTWAWICTRSCQTDRRNYDS